MAQPDPLATINGFLDAIVTVCPHIPRSSLYDTEPALGSQLAQPWGWMWASAHSSAHRENDTTGNRPGRANAYGLLYAEGPYGNGVDRTAEQRRVYTTYAAIAALLLPEEGTFCLASSPYLEVLNVSWIPNPGKPGPFLQIGGREWLGVIINVETDERY